jgi:polyisoprenoid-binding protein YceI
MNSRSILLALALLPLTSLAKPVTYTLDPNHTFPSFAAPHIAGISTWRGKIDRTAGTVVLDREGRTGSVDITMQADSVDFGLPLLNEHAREKPGLFDAGRYPTLTYKADRIRFEGDTPVEIDGQLTMHGVTRPVPLKIDHFKCIADPTLKNKQRCGADASGQLNRAEFGMDYAVDMTGSPMVQLQIQVEGLAND